MTTATLPAPLVADGQARHNPGMDYYDYSPRVVLDKPVALAGFFGAGTEQIAHELAALYAVPSLQLNRSIEHAAGMSRSQLHWEQGESAVRAEEARQLQHAVRQRPAPVIALGDGMLLSGLNWGLVRERCRLVYIQRPLPISFARLRDSLTRFPGSEPLFMVAAPNTAEDLQALFDQRQLAYASAHIIIDAQALHASRVSTLVSAALGWPE